MKEYQPPFGSSSSLVGGRRRSVGQNNFSQNLLNSKFGGKTLNWRTNVFEMRGMAGRRAGQTRRRLSHILGLLADGWVTIKGSKYVLLLSPRRNCPIRPLHDVLHWIGTATYLFSVAVFFFSSVECIYQRVSDLR